MEPDPSSAVDAEALRPWLTLVCAPGVGSRAAARILEHFPSIESFLAAPRAAQAACGLEARSLAALREPAADALERCLRWLQAPDRALITLDDLRYPPLLRQIADPPAALFVLGNPACLRDPQLAIVGSRSPTRGGAETAQAFARHLVECGLTITSGLARGIDGAAHRGALEGGGATVAVLGTGPDRVYPAAHRDLAHEIAARGALVTEFPPGTPPLGGHFPRRNRIISGLALGTLVVEAATQSGSLITARLAIEQGREAFAVPGSIHNPLARGCHALIRDGAKLVETATDILEELGPLAGVGDLPRHAAAAPATSEPELDADYSRLLECLGFDPLPVDVLVQRSGLTADCVSSMLLVLELRGLISSVAGGRYQRNAE